MKSTIAVVAAVVGLGVFAGAAPASVSSAVTKVAYAQQYSMGGVVGTPGTDVWTCSGYRLTAGASVQDHFTCTIADQTFGGTFTQAIRWPCGCSGWNSDYDGAQAKTYAIHVGRGVVVGVATY